ncbi:hypothetical protein ASPZODRAFT_85965 [Penicilliopsis zonata CBS 506.65]|uniref:RING-type E3 ubiquitin transferase n=1 Tax=Penicilliopsis zonata CBS 506.65 TaxID=1073090 RepID=A0A1L9STK7_9EURO|nr:hypothetical protein ASPZODRAFT_85965 [Penicilliopsis zonata CBS 506.65]OJJ50540.1 hypothetical protein ASPZODRAFT_85965 [Penicilliopsis zonata CBS 506.65]
MDFDDSQPHQWAKATPFSEFLSDTAAGSNGDKGKGREMEDPDTCRICRGEGTEEEPLFFPCKCSGSIKFVHQSCLVEWLSHSQKKYCELCKTPFRFTKLYDPEMPQDLPMSLFLRQVVIYSLHTVLTWLRFVLVAFVWLGWLPWSMRAIWRALFWLADGRWSDAENAQGQMNSAQALKNETASLALTLASTSTTPTPVSAPTEPAASSVFSFVNGEPFMLTLFKQAFSAVFVPAASLTNGSTDSNSSNNTAGYYRLQRSSWLSDVKFLNSLTPSPTINNILIDTLEGQLITLLVVISFILVFLIREWVVQQQPLANIPDGERDAAVQLIANNENNRPRDQEDAPDNVQPHVDEPVFEEDQEARFNDMVDNDILADSARRFDVYEPPFSFRNETSDHEDGAWNSSSPHEEDAMADLELLQKAFARNGGFPGPQTQPDWPGFQIFRDLWARGNENPSEVIRIIHEEGRQEELEWIIIFMNRFRRGQSFRSMRDDLERIAEVNDGAFGPSRRQDDDMTQNFDADEEDSRAENSLNPTMQDVTHNTEQSNFLTSDTSSSRPSGQDFTFTFPISQHDNRIGSAHGIENIGNPREDVPPRENESEPTGFLENNAAAEDILHGGSEPLRPSGAESPTLGPPKNFVTKVFDWFWGDFEPTVLAEDPFDENGVHQLENDAMEAPFLPLQNHQRPAVDDILQDIQVIEPDEGDANDPDVIDDGDDLEGIFELIGMQGPVFGLLQNGVFSALLVSFTVAVGIWLPYLWGKIALVLLANPIQLFFGVPFTAVSVVADIVLDTLIGSVGYIMYLISFICSPFIGPLSAVIPLEKWFLSTRSVTSTSISLIDGSSHRLGKLLSTFFVFHESDLPLFSVISHRALKIHEARISSLLQWIIASVKFILQDLPARIVTLGPREALSLDISAIDIRGLSSQLLEEFRSLGSSGLFTISSTKWENLEATRELSAQLLADQDLAIWDTKDRIIAIIMGYMLASVAGVLYLRITNFLYGASRDQRIEGLVAEVLHQAGGVMKVILIIGIEMIVFPLYCGSLLDAALLPLFENATITSRIEFTTNSPLTSLFVHWFIGTCYMFHFALFVSMCRKIMRTGVLYFIRDPDDPTFHPVRDVLERNITTQLRKIAFSALVYGALVTVCLGGVVWGLYFAFDDVLPIRWSATLPVLEFPVDLLFYNFVMPLALRSLKPSDGLQNIYAWWFRHCAHWLRLSDFFFSERRPDEEGHHVRRTWQDVLHGKKGDINHPVVNEEQRALAEAQGLDAYFVRDGRFVRAPASDQVRIPKGNLVFLEVTEANERVDGAADPDDGLHGRASDMFAKVYIPPFFRVRVAAFIFLIWVFAATTGVGITILPLVIGRKFIAAWFPESAPINDLYAFSTGLYIAGAVAYVAFYCKVGFALAKERVGPYLASPRQTLVGVYSGTLHALRLIYLFLALSFLLPSIFALITELYILVPIHTYLGGGEAHVIHFVQDWTLGVLYVQMGLKFLSWHSTSRPAAVLNAVFRDGWFNPNVRLASRAFIVPSCLFATIAMVLPLSLGFALNHTVFRSSSSEVQAQVYRYAFPATFAVGLLTWFVHFLQRKVERWRVNIRDDVYLIGERLHNFSEKRAKDVGMSRRVITG